MFVIEPDVSSLKDIPSHPPSRRANTSRRSEAETQAPLRPAAARFKASTGFAVIHVALNPVGNLSGGLKDDPSLVVGCGFAAPCCIADCQSARLVEVTTRWERTANLLRPPHANAG